MNKQFTQVLQLIHAGLDLVFLNLSFLCWFFFVQDKSFFISDGVFYNFLLLLNLSWFLFGILGDVYNANHILSLGAFVKRTVRIYLFWLLLVSCYVLITRPDFFSDFLSFMAPLFFGACLVLDWCICMALVDFLKKKGYLSENVLIIGYNEMTKKLVSYLETETTNTAIVGFCEDQSRINELTNYPVLCSISDAAEVSKQYRINQIYSTVSPEEDFRIRQVMRDADNACIHFKLVPDLSQFVKLPFHMSSLNDIPVLFLRDEPLTDLTNIVMKRIFDVLFSVLALVLVCSWLFPVIALLIKLTSRGPVIYMQNRLGQTNKVFRMLKFRTMKVMEEDGEFTQVTRNDPRVTRLGQFLRRTSLDELPQFLNVLKGQMSVVGPRPHPLRLNEKYKELIEMYMSRHFLKPGITGWAQVNGCRGETRNTDEMKARIEKDIWYMENWNFWLDVKIIFKTVFTIFRKEEKAY